MQNKNTFAFLLFVKTNQPLYPQICQISLICNCFFPIALCNATFNGQHSYCKNYTVEKVHRYNIPAPERKL